MIYLYIYLAVISLISIFVCIYDKWAATHRPKKRTREATLLLLSALGGSVAMLITMYAIRHKTKHPKFMIGIPLIIVLQAAAAVGVYFLVK
jgi:Predicted membrane protein